jgi:hypothetical protein
VSSVSTARRLWDACEPVAGSVYFVPQCRERYRALGMRGRQGYFWSRTAPMGAVSPGVTAATFAVFEPDLAREHVAGGMAACSREDVLRARFEGIAEAFREVLAGIAVGEAVDLLRPVSEAGALHGRPQYAGRRDLPWPSDPHAALFHACDLVREYRSDAHIAVWTGDGLHPVEVMAVTELFWGVPARMHLDTRQWPEEVVTAGYRRLRDERGWLDAQDRLTDAGLTARRSLEARTDAAMADMAAAADRAGIDRIGAALRPIARRILDAGLYPMDTELQHGPAQLPA